MIEKVVFQLFDRRSTCCSKNLISIALILYDHDVNWCLILMLYIDSIPRSMKSRHTYAPTEAGESVRGGPTVPRQSRLDHYRAQHVEKSPINDHNRYTPIAFISMNNRHFY